MKKNSEKYFNEISDILKALGHPLRLKIVAALRCDACNVNKMVEKLGVSQSSVSQHLGILRSQGIIVPEQQGVKRCYKIADSRVLGVLEALEI